MNYHQIYLKDKTLQKLMEVCQMDTMSLQEKLI